MTLPLMRALQYRDEKRASKPAVFLKREGIVGNSPKLKHCLDLLAQYRDFRQSARDKAEKKYFEDLMGVVHGNIKEACQISGLGRTRLYTLMKKHGVLRLGWTIAKPS